MFWKRALRAGFGEAYEYRHNVLKVKDIANTQIHVDRNGH
jgi:hypothetical protein